MSRNESWRMALSLCRSWKWRRYRGMFRSHYYITHWPDFFFPWEALLRHRLHFTHRRQRDCLILNSPRTFPLGMTWPPSSVYITYIHSFSLDFKLLSRLIEHFSSLARRLGRFLALTERFELVQAGFLVYRRMAIMLEVLEIHWGLHLLDHLGMNIDDQTSLTEVIPNSSNNHNNNGLDMIQIFRNRTQVHLRLPLLNRV